MATPSTTPFHITGDNAVDAATHGYYWNLDNTRTVRWSLSGGWNGEYWNSVLGTASQLNVAFSTFSYYANINFQYSGYFLTPGVASLSSDINIAGDAANVFFGAPNQMALGYFPTSTDLSAPYYAGRPGDIYLNLNSQANSFPSYAQGSAGFALFLHEIGHTVGLKHPFDDGGTGRPTFADLGIAWLDTEAFSIMSYNETYEWNQISWSPATPMLLDVLAMQALYGPNTSTNAGNTVLALAETNLYQTYWDASGIDRVSAANASGGWTIMLPEDQFSTIISTKAGYAKPTAYSGYMPTTLYWLAGDIEDATGSAYADVIIGSSLDNYLFGNGGSDSLAGEAGNDSIWGGTGNDVINGGSGSDTAAFSSARGNVSIVRTSSGYRVSTFSDGTDTLSGIERLSFSDTTLDMTYNDPVQQLYISYFGRAADPTGLSNFSASLAAAGAPTDIQSLNAAYATNTTVRTLVDAFGTSAESNALYSGDTSSFVTAVFQNVLNRAPQTGGLAFWASAIDSGWLTRGNSALAIMAGALTNTSAQGLLDAALVSNKIRVASNFTFALDTSSEISAYRGSTAAATVRSMLSAINAATDVEAYQTTVSSTIASLAAGRSQNDEGGPPFIEVAQIVGVPATSEYIG